MSAEDTRVTIHVNSKKVLEELLADEQETLVVLKDKALQQFANMHLRPKFDEHTQDWMNNTFLRNVRKQVREACAEEIKVEELEPYIRECVTKVINKIIDEELQEMIETKVRDLIEKKLKKIKL